ncbi:MAG: glycosyltransferase involved in cell wall biosynthesis, partial [Lentimonas sp.]
KKQAQTFVEWCENAGVDIVFGINSIAILSALPHLPQNIRVMSRCANAFDHGYRITVSCYERLSRIIALAPRQVDDLISIYGAEKDRIELIPNGTSTERFEKASQQPRGTSKAIRLGFLGRFEHKQKGILYLPEILNRLKEKNVDFSLSIAGKGVHETVLKRRLASFIESGEVRFFGTLGPDQIADFFANIDVYIFPSHFEGSPNALIEALMSGCVPVAWQIDGIIDFIIDDEVNGMLATTGDSVALAAKIAGLASNRERLKAMSRQAAQTARNRFSLTRVANDYAKLVCEVMNEPAIPYQVKAWEHFQIDPAFYQPLWRRVIPAWSKKLIKKLLFKLRLSDRNE